MKRLLLIILLLGCDNTTEPKDCAGVSGGYAEIDDCGLCTGGTTGLIANYLKDCAGECGGSATEDCAGNCNGSATEDCAGDCNGSAVVDQCGICNGDGYSCEDFQRLSWIARINSNLGTCYCEFVDSLDICLDLFDGALETYGVKQWSEMRLHQVFFEGDLTQPIVELIDSNNISEFTNDYEYFKILE